MNQIEQFSYLKEKVLTTFQTYFPYYKGTLLDLSSKDISNLIVVIQEKTNASISEKWVYTHLKKNNQKLPRKDMLDILAEFSGYENWDRFCYSIEETSQTEKVKKTSKKGFYLFLFSFVALFTIIVLWLNQKSKEISYEMDIKNEYTKEGIQAANVQLYKKDSTSMEVISATENIISLKNVEESSKIIIESPYYESKEIEIEDIDKEIMLKPNDGAMIIKAYMHADIKNWEYRKKHLQKILADNLEVILMLKNNLGAEYFNKEEFIQKLVVPTNSLKSLEIVEIKNDSLNKINFIRLIHR